MHQQSFTRYRIAPSAKMKYYSSGDYFIVYATPTRTIFHLRRYWHVEKRRKRTTCMSLRECRRSPRAPYVDRVVKCQLDMNQNHVGRRSIFRDHTRIDWSCLVHSKTWSGAYFKIVGWSTFAECIVLGTNLPKFSSQLKHIGGRCILFGAAATLYATIEYAAVSAVNR